VQAKKKLRDLMARKKAQKEKDRGKFSRMFGKGEYAEEKTDRCVHCKEPVVAGEWFSGKYFTLKEGKVHEECKVQYDQRDETAKREAVQAAQDERSELRQRKLDGEDSA
jgi:hypothetical protein